MAALIGVAGLPSRYSFGGHAASPGPLLLSPDDAQGPGGRRLRTSKHRAILTWTRCKASLE